MASSPSRDSSSRLAGCADRTCGEYLTARALRILPGYYVCLIVTAFVIAPIGVAIQGGAALKLLFSTAPFEYV